MATHTKTRQRKLKRLNESSPRADKPRNAVEDFSRKRTKLFRNLLVVMICICIVSIFFLNININKISTPDDDEHEVAEESKSSVKTKLWEESINNVKVLKPKLSTTGKLLSPLKIRNTTSSRGTQIQVETLYQSDKSSTRIYQIDDFLTKDECDGLCHAHLKYVKKSEEIGPIFCFSDITSFRKYLREAEINTIISSNDFILHTGCVNETLSATLSQRLKYSFSTAFYPGESKFSTIYEDRLREVTGLLPSHGGKFQITSYPKGIGYKTHTDCSLDSDDLRDRYATALVYLQNVKDGGETVFPKLGVKVKPKKGRLVVWTNMNEMGECDPLSIHEAAPVIKGRKYILQRWYYYERFQSLGKRPIEPALPQRKQFQPRVSCDTYDEGSCRWYDEWGYDHIDEYNQQKHQLA